MNDVEYLRSRILGVRKLGMIYAQGQVEGRLHFRIRKVGKRYYASLNTNMELWQDLEHLCDEEFEDKYEGSLEFIPDEENPSAKEVVSPTKDWLEDFTKGFDHYKELKIFTENLDKMLENDYLFVEGHEDDISYRIRRIVLNDNEEKRFASSDPTSELYQDLLELTDEDFINKHYK